MTNPGPYREPAPRPPRLKPVPSPEAVARGSSSLAAVPLGVMAVAFFLPAVDACHEVQSAFDASLGDPRMALWVVPPYLAAAVLAVGTLAALRKGRSPGPLLAWLAAATLAVGVLTSLAVPVEMIGDSSGADTALALAMFVGAAVCGIGIVGAMRKRGYSRWFRLLGAHALLAAPLGGFLAFLGVDGALRIGGYAYVLSASAILWIQGTGLLRLRRARLRRPL